MRTYRISKAASHNGPYGCFSNCAQNGKSSGYQEKQQTDIERSALNLSEVPSDEADKADLEHEKREEPYYRGIAFIAGIHNECESRDAAQNDCQQCGRTKGDHGNQSSSKTHHLRGDEKKGHNV
jgi:hypothetical protein